MKTQVATSRISHFIDCFSTILEDEVKCWKYNMTFEYPLQDWWRMQSSKCQISCIQDRWEETKFIVEATTCTHTVP